MKEGSFITYNVSSNNDDLKIDIMKIDIPDENVLFLIGKDLKYIWDFDIKNFNFVIFENDIENINDNEFEYFWNKFFIPWIQKLSNDYYEIDLDNFKTEFVNTYQKKFLIKKIIHFVMMFFPYYIFKSILENKEIENKKDAFSLLNTYESNPKILRDDLDKEFNQVMNKSKNFLESLNNLLKFAKKGELEKSIDILDEQLRKQDEYLEIFIQFLKKSDIDNIINLLRTYIENDFENLI